jgi:hypothetical protein
VAISIVQSFVKDPNPIKFDYYDNGNGGTQFNNSFSAAFGSNTTSGNTLLCIPVIATDGPNRIQSVSDPVNGAWASVGDLLNFSDCNCDIHPFVKFNASPLLTTSWTGTGAVSSGGVLTIGSGSGPFRIGQRVNSAHTPAPTATGNDVIVVSKISGTLGVAGSTYQLSPVIGAITFSSEAMTTTDFVSTNLNLSFAADYQGAYIAELSGTDGSSIYFSGNNDAPTSAGTDTVTSGNVSALAKPGLMIGFGFNGGVNNSNAFPPLYAPSAGTGYTNSSRILQYDQGNPICTLEWQHFASVGTRAATFSPTADSRYATVAVAFLDSPATSIAPTTGGIAVSAVAPSVAQSALGSWCSVVFSPNIPNGPVFFSWQPPTQNADGSAITAGEITGYEVGVRTSAGSPGTYPILLDTDGPFTSADLIANIQPPLSPGVYFAAVRSLGPTNSPWSPELSFMA